MTNCYHQFEIEGKARKLYAFHTPWGIFQYKRMVMGTSPASSEIQKKIRELSKIARMLSTSKMTSLSMGKDNNMISARGAENIDEA